MIKMKDSGIEWIREIPDDWTILKLKYFFKINTGLSITKENLADKGVYCINYGEIHSKYDFDLDLERDFLYCVNESYLDSNSSSLVSIGDFIFCDTSEDLEGSGNFVYIINNNFKQIFAGSHTIVCKKNNFFNSRYLAYLFKTNCWKSQIQCKVTGTKVYSITQRILKESKAIFPPTIYQTAIVNYLDSKCSKIDFSIEREKQHIEKLKEYKKAVITEAVTKGLDPNVPMKDSGIEWIGEVPEGWKVGKLKHYTKIKDGTHDTPEYIDPSEISIPLITSKDIKNQKITFEEAKHISVTDYEKINLRSNVEMYNIIMPMIGTVGNPSIVLTERKFSIKNVALFKTNTILKAKYLQYYLTSNIIKYQFDLSNKGGVQQFVSLEILNNVYIILPRDIQIINDYLDLKTTRIENAISKKETLIQKLIEYKKSLIYEAVTGKLDLN